MYLLNLSRIIKLVKYKTAKNFKFDVLAVLYFDLSYLKLNT